MATPAREQDQIRRTAVGSSSSGWVVARDAHRAAWSHMAALGADESGTKAGAALEVV